MRRQAKMLFKDTLSDGTPGIERVLFGQLAHPEIRNPQGQNQAENNRGAKLNAAFFSQRQRL